MTTRVLRLGFSNSDLGRHPAGGSSVVTVTECIWNCPLYPSGPRLGSGDNQFDVPCLTQSVKGWSVKSEVSGTRQVRYEPPDLYFYVVLSLPRSVACVSFLG